MSDVHSPKLKDKESSKTDKSKTIFTEGSARALLKPRFILDHPKRFWWTIVESLAQLGSREREKRLNIGSQSNPIKSDSSLNFTTEGVWRNLGTGVELHYHPA